MAQAQDDGSALQQLLRSLAPCGAPMTIRETLQPDEARWFVAGLRASAFTFRDCPVDCFRRKKWHYSGPDHFETPLGKPRHLFSRPNPAVASLNREYIPHLAAYSRLILDLGYERGRSSFSYYRTFTRDLIVKRAGQSYETDAEFHDHAGHAYLEVEAKGTLPKTERLAAEVSRAGSLARLSQGTVKEIEYVLDLAPSYLWIVGPGSIDPETHVFKVEVNGLHAVFRKTPVLPPPPPGSHTA